MPTSDLLTQDNPQRLSSSCERRIGFTRYTEDLIENGPDALMSNAFEYLITDYVDTFYIYDSLDSMFRTATLIMSDPINWRVVAPLTGNEIISIAYKNGLTSSDSKEKIIHFRISNIREEQNSYSAQAGFKNLIINLVEFPAFDFLTSKQYYKTYPIDADNTPNLRLTDIVGDMLGSIQYLSLWYDVEIESSTKNALTFFVPNWLPIKVINYCKKYAISEKKQYPNYTFHIGNDPTKDKPIISFKPIFSYIDNNKKFRKYGTSLQEVNKDDMAGSNDSQYNPLDIISTYTFQYYDAQITPILSGNTEFIFDYMSDNEYICSDYKNYLERKYKSINPYVIYPSSYGNQWSSFHRSGWNKKSGETLIKGELYNEYAKGILLNGVYCESMSNIFEGRSVGERAELKFNVNNDNKEYDEMFSGAWLTWSVDDHFVQGKCFSSIKFLNDSFVNITDPSRTIKSINTITSPISPEGIKE